MNYYVSDLHFFCRSQTNDGDVNYDNRPFASVEEMHEYMLQRWNQKITNADTVYILGDIAMRGKNDKLIALFAQLRGKKVLIKGNHDDLTDYRYKQLFDDICDYKELTDNFDGKAYKLVLCHYPILMWNGQHRGTILLYGHTHNSIEDTFFQNCVKELNNNKKFEIVGGKEIKVYNVGCMKSYMSYEPRTLKEILSYEADNDNKTHSQYEKENDL